VSDLRRIARELYALPPAEFTAARTARAEGMDPVSAARVRELRRHAAGAWGANLLARDAALDELLGLGAELRAAHADADRDALTRLARARRALVGELVDLAAARAADAGGSLTAAARAGLEATLEAATVSEDAAHAVRSGRLVRTLEAVGLEVDLRGAVAVPDDADDDAPPRRPRLRIVRDPDAEVARLRDEAATALAAARTAAEDATAALLDVETRVRELEERQARAADEAGELEAALRRARDEVAAIEREQRAAGDLRARRERAATRAAETLAAAQRRLDELGG